MHHQRWTCGRGGARAAGLLLAVAAACAAAPAARAHGIETSLQRLSALREGFAASGYQLESSFSSGEPAGDAVVRAVPPSGGAGVEIGRTDAQGRLRFRLPAQVQADWELQVDAGPGHRDYLELPGGQAGPPAALAPVKPSRWRPLLPAASALALVGLLGLGVSRRRP